MEELTEGLGVQLPFAPELFVPAGLSWRCPQSLRIPSAEWTFLLHSKKHSFLITSSANLDCSSFYSPCTHDVHDELFNKKKNNKHKKENFFLPNGITRTPTPSQKSGKENEGKMKR